MNFYNENDYKLTVTSFEKSIQGTFSERFLFNVLDQDGNVKILDVPKTTAYKIFEAIRKAEQPKRNWFLSLLEKFGLIKPIKKEEFEFHFKNEPFCFAGSYFPHIVPNPLFKQINEYNT